MSNLVLYTSLSVLATAVCIGHGYNQAAGNMAKIIAYVAASKTNILIMVNMAYNLLFLFGKLLQVAFFGKLREGERKNMYDRVLNYILFKFIFFGAILDPDFKEVLIWTFWFSILGFMRIFSLLSRDRFEYIATYSPNATWKTHTKMLVFLSCILVTDLCLFYACVTIFQEAGYGVLLLLTFECFTLFLDTVQTVVKYSIHLIDLSRDGNWEQRGVYLYYTEFITDSLILVTTLAHYMHIFLVRGFSLAVSDFVLLLHMRIVFNNLREKFVVYRNYRKLQHDMNTRYPYVSDEELAAYDDDCAICRIRMTQAKRLPCGHIFHYSCLRSWLEQHHSCPTCRRSLIDAQPIPRTVTPPPPAPSTSGTPPPSIAGPAPSGSNTDPAAPAAANPPQERNEQSLFHFNSERFFGWLPALSVEVVRRPAAAISPEMIRMVQDIFPDAPDQVIAQDLSISGSVDATIENFLEGRVQWTPVQQTPLAPAPVPAPSASQAITPALNPLSASAPVPPPNPLGRSSNAPTATTTIDAAANNLSKSMEQPALKAYPSSFATNPQDRFASFQARKQQMLETARKRFLEKQTQVLSKPLYNTPAAKPISSSGSSPITTTFTTEPTTSPAPTAAPPSAPAQAPTAAMQRQSATTLNDPSSLSLSLEERRKLALEAAERRMARH